MAISFIPNQPILFQDPLFAGQTCLNNDVREYAQLAEAEDNMCIQFINEPVATLISCSMNEFSNELINGDFATNLNSFDEYDFSTGTNTGAPVIWTWSDNGAQSNPFVTNIGLVQTLPGAIGDIFLISFEFTYDNADTFLIGVGSQASNSFNTVNLLNNFETNIDGRKSIILSSYLGLDFAFYCDNSAVTIKNIIVPMYQDKD